MGTRSTSGTVGASTLPERMAIDTWWEVGTDQERMQRLGCYSPQDFEALLAPTGLGLDVVATLIADDDRDQIDLGHEVWSYVAVLRRTQPRCR